MARRIGVRAQFGDALVPGLMLLGRIGIRPQICYRCWFAEVLEGQICDCRWFADALDARLRGHDCQRYRHDGPGDAERIYAKLAYNPCIHCAISY